MKRKSLLNFFAQLKFLICVRNFSRNTKLNISSNSTWAWDSKLLTLPGPGTANF